ncbi:MAG: ribonuclease P protein component [Pseudomonadota bacterium]
MDPHQESIPDLVTLKKRGQFLRLRRARSFSTPSFTIVTKPRQGDTAHVGIGYTVTKKVGNSVVRNRVRRRLRHLGKAMLPFKGLPGHDYVVIARPAALRSEFATMLADFSKALDHVNAKSANGPGNSRQAD